MENNTAGKDAAQALSQMVNRMGDGPERKDFIDAVTNNHRTLQPNSSPHIEKEEERRMLDEDNGKDVNFASKRLPI